MESITTRSELLQGFRGSCLILCSSIFIGVFGQHLFHWVDAGQQSISTILPFALVGLSLLVLYLRSIRLLSTPYFATTSLIAIAVSTALGTFISQNLGHLQFAQRYGSFSDTLQFFHIDDVFHSWWFAGLFILLAISLVGIILEYPFNFKNLGFYLAHLSPILILVGFWIDFYSGFRGLVALNKGEETNMCARFFRNSTFVLDTVALDISIRLDSFSTEKFDPDYRIQVWKKDAVWSNNRDVSDQEMSRRASKILTTMPLDTGRRHHIFGTDISFQVKEVYRDLQFTYSHPSYDSNAEAQDPGIILQVSTILGKQRAILKANDPNSSSIEDPNIGARVKFYWELPDSVQQQLDPLSDKWKEKNWILIEGKSQTIRRIAGETTTLDQIQFDKFYRFSEDRAGDGFEITHLFPDGSLLKATPFNRSDQWGIIHSLNREFLWILIISAILGAAAGYFLTDMLLSEIYEYHIAVGMLPVILSALLIFSAGYLTTSRSILKAANSNLMDALQIE